MPDVGARSCRECANMQNQEPSRTVIGRSAPRWSTVGLVETNRGSGSGVMIGPRHLLTVSHVIDWTAPEGFAADWVRFTPSSFDGDAPFGESYGVHIYWYLQEDGDGFITGDEGNFDYVVVVLDRRLGETTGWMGARGIHASICTGRTASMLGRRHRWRRSILADLSSGLCGRHGQRSASGSTAPD